MLTPERLREIKARCKMRLLWRREQQEKDRLPCSEKMARFLAQRMAEMGHQGIGTCEEAVRAWSEAARRAGIRMVAMAKGDAERNDDA